MISPKPNHRLLPRRRQVDSSCPEVTRSCLVPDPKGRTLSAPNLGSRGCRLGITSQSIPSRMPTTTTRFMGCTQTAYSAPRAAKTICSALGWSRTPMTRTPTEPKLVADGIIYNYKIPSDPAPPPPGAPHSDQAPNMASGFGRIFGPSYYLSDHAGDGTNLAEAEGRGRGLCGPDINAEFYDDIAHLVPNYNPTSVRGAAGRPSSRCRREERARVGSRCCRPMGMTSRRAAKMLWRTRTGRTSRPRLARSGTRGSKRAPPG